MHRLDSRQSLQACMTAMEVLRRQTGSKASSSKSQRWVLESNHCQTQWFIIHGLTQEYWRGGQNIVEVITQAHRQADKQLLGPKGFAGMGG